MFFFLVPLLLSGLLFYVAVVTQSTVFVGLGFIFGVLAILFLILAHLEAKREEEDQRHG